MSAPFREFLYGAPEDGFGRACPARACGVSYEDVPTVASTYDLFSRGCPSENEMYRVGMQDEATAREFWLAAIHYAALGTFGAVPFGTPMRRGLVHNSAQIVTAVDVARKLGWLGRAWDGKL